MTDNTPNFGSLNDPFDQEHQAAPPTPPIPPQVPEEPKASVVNPEDDYMDPEPQSPTPPPTTPKDPEPVVSMTPEEKQQEIFDKVLGEKHLSTLNDLPEKGAKVHLSTNPFKEMSQREFEEELSKRKDIPVAIPSVTLKQFQNMVKGIPNVDLQDSPTNRELMAIYRSSYNHLPKYGGLQSTVDNEERDFYQELPVDGGVLKPMKPKMSINPATKPTGEQAVIRMNALMGKGGVINVPLYHSGFWVSIKNPPDSRLIDMEYEIVNSKVVLGRNLLGSIFSNDRLFMVQALLQLFRECVYNTTLQEATDNLFDKIKLHDINTIAWAMASMIYPNGVPYSRIIYSENIEENRVAKGIVDISKLLWVDRNALSEDQMRHMARNRKPTMSDLELEKYQEKFKLKMTKRVKLDDIMTVVLGVPTITDYLIFGENWINTNIARADAIIEDTEDEVRRNELITNYFKSDLLSQYRHFIKEVILTPEGGEEEVYGDDDKDTIDKMLSSISTNDAVIDMLLKEITQFIDDTQVSIIATPTLTEEPTQSNRFPHLVPMDPLYTFFTLLLQRTTKISSRTA